MNTKREIDDFLAQKTMAMAGVSRSRESMSAVCYRELKARGYRMLAVNPNAQTIEGDPCYASLATLAEKPEGVIVFTPPELSLQIVHDAKAAGITRLWIQQGAESEATLSFCEQNGISAIHGQCILMYAEPVSSYHRAHRWFKKLIGRLPR